MLILIPESGCAVIKSLTHLGNAGLQVNQDTVWLPEQVLAKYREAKEKGLTKILLLVEGTSGYRFSLLPVR